LFKVDGIKISISFRRRC